MRRDRVDQLRTFTRAVKLSKKLSKQVMDTMKSIWQEQSVRVDDWAIMHEIPVQLFRCFVFSFSPLFPPYELNWIVLPCPLILLDCIMFFSFTSPLVFLFVSLSSFALAPFPSFFCFLLLLLILIYCLCHLMFLYILLFSVDSCMHD